MSATLDHHNIANHSFRPHRQPSQPGRHAQLEDRAQLEEVVVPALSLNVVAAVIVAAAIILALLGFGGGAAASAPEATTTADVIEIWVVQPGDTLWGIAGEVAPEGDRAAVVAALSEAAGGASLEIGQRIVIDHSAFAD